MPPIEPFDILRREDPVDDITTWLLDVVYEEPNLVAACSALVIRDMGLHPKTRLGGNHDDRAEFIREQTKDVLTLEDLEDLDVPDYITEDDPRYDLYWERLNNLINLVLAQAIARQKSRFTLETHRTRAALQLGASANAVSSGEDNYNGPTFREDES